MIYDHDDEVICADVRNEDSMLASMDITGIIHVRNIKDLSDAETILYTLNSIPKEIDDFSRVLFNFERPGCETELIVII